MPLLNANIQLLQRLHAHPGDDAGHDSDSDDSGDSDDDDVVGEEDAGESDDDEVHEDAIGLDGISDMFSQQDDDEYAMMSLPDASQSPFIAFVGMLATLPPSLPDELPEDTRVAMEAMLHEGERLLADLQ